MGKPNFSDDFKAADRAWVTDITYIHTLEGFAYLAVVVDLYSRRVVGWSMQCVARRKGADCR